MVALDGVEVLRFGWPPTACAAVGAVGLQALSPGTRVTGGFSAAAAALSAAAAVVCLVIATASGAAAEVASTAALYAGTSGSAVAVCWSLDMQHEPAADNWPWSIMATGICATALTANEWLSGAGLAAVGFLGGFIVGFRVAVAFTTKWWRGLPAALVVGAVFAGSVRTPTGAQAVGSLEVGLVLGPAGFAVAMMFVTPWVERRGKRMPFPGLPELLLIATAAGLLDAIWAKEPWTAIQLAVLTIVTAGWFGMRAWRALATRPALRPPDGDSDAS